MPKIEAPKAPTKINVKHVGGRPKKIKVSRKDPKIIVSKEDEAFLHLLNSINRTTSQLSHLQGRVLRDSNDIDALFIDNEHLDYKMSVNRVVTTVAFVIAIVALVMAVL